MIRIKSWPDLLYNIVQRVCIMSKKDPRELILEVLRKHPEGLTIVSIAKLSGLHRHTSTKYIHELIGANMIFQRKVGAAKLCYLSDKVSKKSEEEKMLKKLEKRRSPDRYRLKLIISVVLLTFLLSETVILAYQNVSLLNETNLSKVSMFNTSPLTASAISNVSPQISEIVNQTFNESLVSGENETSSIDIPFENTSNVTEDINVSDFINESLEVNINVSETPENESSNETVEFNESINISDIPEIIIEEVQDKFSINLDYSGKITRGESLTLRAIVENTDSVVAENVYLNWEFPEGFVIESGEMSKFCGDIEPSNYCISEILVKIDFSTVLGIRDIKIVVNYEE